MNHSHLSIINYILYSYFGQFMLFSFLVFLFLLLGLNTVYDSGYTLIHLKINSGSVRGSFFLWFCFALLSFFILLCYAMFLIG